MRIKSPKALRARKATATVEFAVIAPIFVLILLGTIETCSMIFLQQSLEIAAYEGSRVAIVQKSTREGVERAINTILQPRRIRDYVVRITPLMALMLPVTLILAAFAINIAMVELNRTEMYVSADSASRAAGREFALTSSQEGAKQAAREAARRNTVGGAALLLADKDFDYGQAFRDESSKR
jgi:Flp pilus assembly protein TadG